MATIDLGKIKQVWRGTWSSSPNPAYSVDDLVEYTDTGVTSTYIAVSTPGSQVPSSGGSVQSNWNLVAKGVTDPIPTQSGNAGKFLKTNGSSTSWDSAGGWVKLAGGTGPSSSVTSISLDNIFSDTYDFYKIFVKWTQDDHLRLRFLKASDGSEESSSNYDWKIISAAENSDESVADYGGNGNNRAMVTYWNAHDNGGCIIEMTFNNPYESNNYSSFINTATTTENSQLRITLMANTYRDNTSSGSHRGVVLSGQAGDPIVASNFNYLVLGAKIT